MFDKIVIVEPVFMEKEGEKELRKYCNELISYDTNASDDKETIARIGDADCILVSWSTIISKEIIESCPSLKHIALCCSFYGKQFAKVDIDAAEKKRNYIFIFGRVWG